MIPSVVAKLVEKWNKAGDEARNKIVAVIFEGCARELEAALATAPPEQARCSVVLTKEGDRCAAEAGHEGAHELDLTAADQPQAASAGALSADWWTEETLDVIRHAMVDGNPPAPGNWENAITNGLLRAFNRGQDALAAHDQKVRAALRNLLDACLVADANEELSELVDGSLLDAARAALAPAPAASKPEAAKEAES